LIGKRLLLGFPGLLEVRELLVGDINSKFIPLMEDGVFGNPVAVAFNVLLAEGLINKA
jgi:hypothetical protein